MKGKRLAIIFASLCCLMRLCAADEYGKVTTENVAPGVYLFSAAGYGDVGLSGNCVAIISRDGVLIFDTSGTPKTAQAVLGELRKLTDQPVRYVVNSHWHWDHWGGNQVFKAAFPSVQIISQEKTRSMMMHDSIEWNHDYLSKDIPEHIKDIDNAISDARSKSAPAERLAEMEKLAADDREFLKEKRELTNTFPNIVFSDKMRLFMGEREIDILHAKAITPGDSLVFLPNEKILLTGDILVYPIPYAIGGTYPTSWIESLKVLKSLDPQVIVPGHGGVERNQRFLDANLHLFEQVKADVVLAKARGLSLAQTQQTLGKNARDYATQLGIAETFVESFKELFLAVFVKNSYMELDGALSDTPAR
jgi:cyclase